MKKFLCLGLMLSAFCISCQTANAVKTKAIPTTQDGTKLKCTAHRINGSIDEYIDTVDYYYFKNNKIYSPNLITLYGDINKDPRKVLRLKITDDKISFKDRFYEVWVADYKWVTIDRNSGEYKFSAKRDFGTWYRRANAAGTCEIVEK